MQVGACVVTSKEALRVTITQALHECPALTITSSTVVVVELRKVYSYA